MEWSHDWSAKKGKLIVDGPHYTYWNSQSLVYVRDGGEYDRSLVGPHFLDLGIMGTCTQQCHGCYMRSKSGIPNMSVHAIDEVLYGMRHSLCQVAFGGAGDPVDHSHFSYLVRAGIRQVPGPDLEEFIAAARNPDLTTQSMVQYGQEQDKLMTISRCVTINPRDRAFTPEKVAEMAKFTAVGLSCGPASGYDSTKNITRLLRMADELPYDLRPRFVLHLIVGARHNDLTRFLHLLTYESVTGVLFLANKRDLGDPDARFESPFDDRDQQRVFWESVSKVHAVLPKRIAVDSCLAPLVDLDLFPSASRSLLHPCDAGRFSVYVDPCRGMWTCSCGDQPVKSWSAVLEKAQVCAALQPLPGQPSFRRAGALPAKRVEWPNPKVVIQRGPMTNSSSTSYFVVASAETPFKLRVLDFVERAKLAATDPGCSGEFSWYKNNCRLVEITLDEWASYCALAIADSQQPEKAKAELDQYTRRLVENGDKAYYLVAKRDDGGVEPMRFVREDVSDDATILMQTAGEEH